MKVKWNLIEGTKSLASSTNNREHDLQPPSSDLHITKKNKCTNTFEIQNWRFSDSRLYLKYDVALKVNWPQSLLISLSKYFIKQLLSSIWSITVLAKLQWSLNSL